jgi:mannitol 2-dehydrogenase
MTDRRSVGLVPVGVAEKTLPDIAGRGVSTPSYDRHSLSPGILHVGVGGFHRAHMAVYTDEVAAAGGRWGIRGVGLLDSDREMADTLRAQDHLYTVIERDNNGTRPRVVGSIVDYAFLAGSDESFARHVANDQVEILSMTITEGGYSLAGQNPTINAIVSALEARRRAGARPLTVLSCDNLPGNGDVAHQAIMTVAAARSDSLAQYVERACAFPNSMVDRITPQTKDEDRVWLRDEFGIDDGWPVVCESFRQWVIEDRFALGRPEWQDSGVLFTDRVHDWERYKLRMLNASHSCMAYLMALAGVVYVDEAVAIPAVRQYLGQFLEIEAIPTLTEIPGHPPLAYAATVLERFGNARIRDQIARLCIDGTAKFPSFLIPTVNAQLERNGPVSRAALALAAWSRYLGTMPANERAPDSLGERTVALATRSINEPLRFLELNEVFPPSVRDSKRFRKDFAAACANLAERGPIGAIEETLAR